MIVQLKEWKLDEAIEIIRSIQFDCQEKCNYHLALAGSVLNYGSSINDLDIIALPMENGKDTHSKDVLALFESRFGVYELASNEEYDTDKKQVYKFHPDGRILDLFLY